MLRIPLVLFAMLCSVHASAGELKKQSSDGEPYPEVSERLTPEVDLPLVDKILGKAPGELSKEIINAGEHQNRNQLMQRGFYTSRDEIGVYELLERTAALYDGGKWIIIGIANSDFGHFVLRDGRITRVVLYYENLTVKDLQQLRNTVNRSIKLSPQEVKRTKGDAESSKMSYLRGTGEKNGAKIEAAIGVSSSVATRGKGRVIVSFGYEPMYLYKLNHQIKPEIEEAIKKATVTEGMTHYEVMLALRRHKHICSAYGSSSWTLAEYNEFNDVKSRMTLHFNTDGILTAIAPS